MSRLTSDLLDRAIATRERQQLAQAFSGCDGAAQKVSLAQALKASLNQSEIRSMVRARGWTEEIEAEAGAIVAMAMDQVFDEERRHD